MTKTMPSEEWIDKAFEGMGIDPDPLMRRILAWLAPQPEWVASAMLNLMKRGVVGVPQDQLQEMWREELAAAKAEVGVDYTVH